MDTQGDHDLWFPMFGECPGEEGQTAEQPRGTRTRAKTGQLGHPVLMNDVITSKGHGE